MAPALDCIVVGAGSAGAVVAARMATSGRRTLLLEAGPDHRRGDLPAELRGADFLAACRPPWIWPDIEAARTPHQEPRLYVRGRVVGGSSAINAMVALWGVEADYEGWGAGRRWADSGDRRRDIEHRLGVQRPPRSPRSRWTVLEQAVLQAALAAGHRWCPDHNRPGALGVGPAALTFAGGRRVSTNDAYLEPCRSSPYLTVRGGAEVVAVLLDGRRAVGVRLAGGEEITARRVVVAAGAIGSPVLLLRSGVQHPAIGHNLADHPSASIPLQLQPAARLAGAPLAAPLNMLLRYRSGLLDGPDGDADMQLIALAARGADPAGRAVGLIQVAVMRSFCRGRVSIDGAGRPVVDCRLLDDERDRRRLRDGLRRAAALTRHPAVRAIAHPDGPLGGTDDGTHGDDGVLDDGVLDTWLEQHSGDYVHACGTCRMGDAGDPSTVVSDRDGAVHGYQRLHVIDASVFPQAPRANPHLSTVLVAELLSDGLVTAPT